MIKIKDREVRPGGCMCEPRSDIPPNWNDIRTKFGYTMLVAIRLRGRHYEKFFKEKDFIILWDER